MQCVKCGSENSPDAKFCRGCGNKLEGTEQVATGSFVKCSNCGHANESGKKFCPKCGTPVTAVSPMHEPSITVISPPPAAPVVNNTAVKPTLVKKNHSKMVIGVVIAIVVLLCTLIGYWFYPMQGSKKTTIPAMSKRTSVATANEIRRDGRFIAYANGTVLDTQTNLMWAAKDNGKGINLANAQTYFKNYRGGGYKDWRMPTQDELAGLYDGSVNGQNGQHLTTLITLTGCCPYASEIRGNNPACFDFTYGNRLWASSPYDLGQALPVRDVKGKSQSSAVPDCAGDNLPCGNRCYNPLSGQACSNGNVICTPEGRRNLLCS
jgi:hypothetical protein